uniref:Predicted protein n=1 Tax=Physcomitrium patens TaxID=3218 RepID=A9U5U8_PHYPA
MGLLAKRERKKDRSNISKNKNGLDYSLELITSIGLGDNDKIVEIHSREVYTILESFQAPEVTIETRYKTTDKKVKPVVRPLPEDSKEQIGEASKEASLRDPMSIGHQFTKETFEELKIGSDGSLLSEEITCFKKMLAKQGRSFAFESYEIGLFHLLCHSENVLSVKGSLKGKNGGESSNGESQFWIQALTAGANFRSKTED